MLGTYSIVARMQDITLLRNFKYSINTCNRTGKPTLALDPTQRPTHWL